MCVILTLPRGDVAQVALFCLHKGSGVIEYLHLKVDIYAFVNDHFDELNCSITGMHCACTLLYIANTTKGTHTNWKKMLYESLLQSKTTFEHKKNDKGLVFFFGSVLSL